MVIVLVVSVCMSDCLSVSVYICNTITFESLDVESSFFVCGYIFGGCRSTQLNADEQIQAQSISEMSTLSEFSQLYCHIYMIGCRFW